MQPTHDPELAQEQTEGLYWNYDWGSLMNVYGSGLGGPEGPVLVHRPESPYVSIWGYVPFEDITAVELLSGVLTANRSRVVGFTVPTADDFMAATARVDQFISLVEYLQLSGEL